MVITNLRIPMTKVDRILAEAMELTDDERSELADRLAKTTPIAPMGEEERAAVLSSVEEGIAAARNGDVVDANEVLDELLSRP
jgi:predicted transcriptional regulator